MNLDKKISEDAPYEKITGEWKNLYLNIDSVACNTEREKIEKSPLEYAFELKKDASLKLLDQALEYYYNNLFFFDDTNRNYLKEKQELFGKNYKKYKDFYELLVNLTKETFILKNEVLKARKLEKNYYTKQPEPVINHYLKVSDRFLQILQLRRISIREKLLKKKSSPFLMILGREIEDLKVVNKYFLLITISAFLHDVVEDKIFSRKALMSFFREVFNLKDSYIMGLINWYLTKQEKESEADYQNRIFKNEYDENVIEKCRYENIVVEKSLSEEELRDALLLAQIIKICDILNNAETKHSDKTRDHKLKRYMEFLHNRFPWVLEAMPDWLKEHILKENPYLKDVFLTMNKKRREMIQDLIGENPPRTTRKRNKLES